MMFILLSPIGWVLLLYVFFIMFVAVMGFYRLKLNNQLTKFLKYLGMPLLIVGYGVDIFVNWTIANVIFWDIPKERLVTSRLHRYMRQEKNDFRKKIAQFICDQMLNMFDPTGKHC